MPAMSSMSRRSLLGALTAHALAMGTAFGRPSPQRAPKPLAKDAVTADWPSFLGPSHNAFSTETKLSRRLPPPLIWEFAKGTAYTSPAVVGDRLLFNHRVGNEEIVECLHPETGARRWRFQYPTV